jgi:hypothetical protein
MTKPIKDLIAAPPQSLEPEFIMASPDEPIRLVTGKFDLLRDGRLLGHIKGEIAIEWVPKLQVVCRGETDVGFAEFFSDGSLGLHVPQLGLTAEAVVISNEMGQGQLGQLHKIEALLMEARRPELVEARQFRFYLVNFPSYLGEPVRTRSRLSRDRLVMRAGPLTCTIDRIEQAVHSNENKHRPGYLLTHVVEVQSTGRAITPNEIQDILDSLYWLFTFMRGARTGPVLPSVDAPFAKHWISIAPWTVDEARRVNSWLPDRSPVNVDGLFEGFIEKWRDPIWNDGLRTTMAWYIAANAPNTPSEAKIVLCQIALEVLASLQGFEGGTAFTRIRGLLQSLGIPTQVPPRLQALDEYANRGGVDAPECLTRIRNKLGHPTAKNRQHTSAVDGITRMQAAQYGIELFELCLLAIMKYRGKYARRAFQGWKGDDEVPMPWI